MGSSISSRFGRASRSFASAIRICQPPENSSVFLCLVGEREAEPLQHLGHARVDLPAAQVLEALRHLGISLEQAVVTLALLGRVGKRVLDPVLLALSARISSKASTTSS